MTSTDQLIKVNHRYGHVFLHLVRTGRRGRTTTVVKLKPEAAAMIGAALQGAAERAKPKLKVKG